jgi:glycosyltransferase 2 family protein
MIPEPPAVSDGPGPAGRSASSANASASSRRRAAIRNGARTLIGIALLVGVAHRMDLSSAWAIAREARVSWLLLALALAVAGRLFAAFRWYLLVSPGNPACRFRTIVRLVFVTTLIGMFTPGGGMGGTALRVYGLTRSVSDLALSFASVLVEGVLAMTALILLVLVGLLFAPPGLPEALPIVAAIGLFFVFAGSVAIFHPLPRRIGARLLQALHLRAIQKRIERFYAALDLYKAQPSIIGWSVLVAFGAVVFRILPTVVLAQAFGLDIALVHFAIFLPVIQFIAQLPISVGGLGVRETAFVSLFALVGVPGESAFTLSLAVYAVTVLSATPGAWFYVRSGIGPEATRPVSGPDAPGLRTAALTAEGNRAAIGRHDLK